MQRCERQRVGFAVALAAHLRTNSGLLDRGANVPRGLRDRHALCTEGDGDAVLLALKAMSEHADELPGISAPGSWTLLTRRGPGLTLCVPLPAVAPPLRSIAMRHHARTILAACAAALVGGCADRDIPTTAPAAGPSLIVNGAPDDAGAYPAVGALLYDFDRNGAYNANDALCTGTLIAPKVVLTAAHCVQFLPAGSALHVSFAADLNGSPATIAAARYVYDERYATRGRAQGHDVAVVILSAPPGITPMRLATAGLLDQLAAQGALRGAVFTNVGYGTSAAVSGRPAFGYDGRRNVSQSPFMALTPTWLGLLINTNATGLGGDCYGDSGGPKFLDRNGYRDVVFATVITGDVPCRATSWDWRTDTPEARSFLGRFVTLP